MQTTCPYTQQPMQARWRESVSRVRPEAVDPTTPGSLLINRDTKIASAGSCFAQHVRNHIVKRGYTYLLTEKPATDLTSIESQKAHYGLFPARFGNIYTTVQLEQLFERAYGRFVPEEDYWEEGGRFYDPFRPAIQPNGFASVAALREDRVVQLDATRRMFEELGVFIFTLGLTEGWRSRADGAVYPICPGCSVGTFDPEKHQFINLNVVQTATALHSFIAKLSLVNPEAKIILTVSPVPLAATMTAASVIEATSYSKAVLRVVAQEMHDSYEHVSYFPSYEIITSTGLSHEYFAPDRRNVLPRGVNRVMDLFFKRYSGEQLEQVVLDAPTRSASTAEPVLCDEDTILRLLDAPSSVSST